MTPKVRNASTVLMPAPMASRTDHRHQRPLATRFVQPVHVHLAPAHHALDDAEHRLHGLYAQSIQCSTRFGAQPKPRQMVLRQPLVYRRWQQTGSASINRNEATHGLAG